MSKTTRETSSRHGFSRCVPEFVAEALPEKRIAADCLGKELGGLENKSGRIGQFLMKREGLEPMGATGIEPMTSTVSRLLQS